MTDNVPEVKCKFDTGFEQGYTSCIAIEEKPGESLENVEDRKEMPVQA